MSEEGNQFIELWGVTCERLENMSNDHLVLIWQGQERSRPSLSVTIKKHLTGLKSWQIIIEWFNGMQSRHMTYCSGMTLDDAKKRTEKEFRLWFEGAKMISGRFT